MIRVRFRHLARDGIPGQHLLKSGGDRRRPSGITTLTIRTTFLGNVGSGLPLPTSRAG